MSISKTNSAEPVVVYTDLMIDLETLSTRQNATIISIGTQFFDIDTGKLGPNKEIIVDYSNAEELGFHICDETKAWWEKQGEDAKRVLYAENRTALTAALCEVAIGIVKSANSKQLRVWGNGATFDITIIENAYYKVLGGDIPWEFRNVRDVRTEVDIGLIFNFDPHHYMPFEGVKHNAADDAKHKAKYVSAIYRLVASAYKNSRELI